MERLKPDGPGVGQVTAQLREALRAWSLRRGLCERLVAALALPTAAEHVVSDEACGVELPLGRVDPVLGKVPVEDAEGADRLW